MKINEKIIIFILFFPCPLLAIDCVATVPVLEYLLKEIGGDRIKTITLCPPNQNFHNLVIKPSHVAAISRCEIFYHLGLDAEPWKSSLLEAANNRAVMVGGKGDLDGSQGIEILEVPSSVSREKGDIHAFGNPHYWLDPVNLIKMANHLTTKLSELSPSEKPFFTERFTRFGQRWGDLTRDWVARACALKGRAIITYHNSWPYLIRRFQLTLSATIEPKPGISPSGASLNAVIQRGRETHAELILGEPHNPLRDMEMVSHNLNHLPVLVQSQFPSGNEGITMEGVFEAILSTLEKGR